MKRRLAAILAADVVGFTRLMEQDEVGTLNLLKAHRTEFIEPTISEHNDRVIKLMGDGILVEFASVLDSVNCAVAIQNGMKERQNPEQADLQFRIGLNLGDVIVEGDDLYGDGINIASRLEGLADPGGVCVSDKVYQEAKNKVSVDFESMGDCTVKNVTDPISAYKIALGENVLRHDIQAGDKLPVPEKPSIAVLPFDNMSNDPEQDFLADGLSEDLITALSKIRWFFVIARNSTFTYKGQAVDIKQVGEELGVRYVLEGSVRKAGNRVRVTVQLIEAASGNHVWAERFDRELADIFDLQDEIVMTIAGAIEPELSAAERQRAVAKQPENMDAWESYQHGVWHMWKYLPEELDKGFTYLQQATELDPNFALAHAYTSYTHYQRVVLGCSDDDIAELEMGLNAAERALKADDQEPVAHFAIGRIHMMQGRHDESIAALEAAIRINPSHAQAYHGLGMTFTLSGKLDEAKASCLQSERLSPRDPIHWASTVVHGLACILAKEYEEGVHWARVTKQNPRSTSYWPHAVLAAGLAQMDEMEEAKACMADAMNEKPDLSLDYIARVLPTKFPDGLDPYLEGLRKAGMPGK